MRLRRRKRMHSAVEASSLSDILFFLLLFFLMISTMASPEAIRILLPKSATGKTIPKHAINLTIDKDLSWTVDKTPVFNEQELGAKLAAEAAAHNNDVTVVLRMDKTISVEEMIRVVDIINQQKLPMVIATEKKSE